MFINARVSLLLPLLFCACAGGAALAQSLPQPASQNGVSYITGGVGEDEVQAFRAAAPGYNLRMTFASKTGNYLSDIDVTITSGAGRPILSVRIEGPFLFVRLPAGRHQIGAQTRHITETRKIQVPAHGGV
ncbi:carboxypeptidase regulatory-like domain-containing protein [Paraburkholderia sp. BL17N1]|uniref:carboxypeptidase regulatory-like domain-containing protein n=1 Tax=Paraburkholderia sp. BL17N1 TaxID=1938798 RepID=UPI001F546667|nr:carboxypeptidase regulatory-like domain-containing protein [Paraburkholderia sp. BL17N1]